MKKVYAIAALYAKEMREMEEKRETFLSENSLDRKAYSDYDSEYGEDRPYQVINGIALYDIRGKMVSTSDMWTRWMGIQSYDVLAGVMSQMSQDEEVDRVLISMDTPGGSVSGIADISDTWSRLNAIKPITVHTPGMLASAGIWLAANSTKIYASETADVGSIGVILQHASYEESLKKQGIKVTEIKSAPMKAIGSPAKDLSEAERAHLQKKVDESDALFKKQVYTKRPGVNAEAFTGETFSASEGLRLGLIDGISTFSQVFEELSASADSNDNHSYMEDYSMKKKVTAAMAEAAIQAGASPDSFEIVTQEAYDAHLKEEVIETPEENLEAETPEENLEAETPEETLEATDETPDFEAQVVVITGELGIANAQIETLTAEIADLNTKLGASGSEPLRVIAEERISVMRVALGMSAMDVSKFSTESVLADYNALSEQFASNFKSGGHVTPKANTPAAPTKKAVVTRIDTARTGAVGSF